MWRAVHFNFAFEHFDVKQGCDALCTVGLWLLIFHRVKFLLLAFVVMSNLLYRIECLYNERESYFLFTTSPMAHWVGILPHARVVVPLIVPIL